MKSVLAMAISAAVLVAGAAHADSYTVDPAHTTIA